MWDGAGSPAFAVDVLVAGRRIERVAPALPADPGYAPTLDAIGHTVIPGVVEGHAHLSCAHKASGADTGDIPPEDHALLTLHHARLVLEAGFTSCLSGGSVKARLDIALRDFIEAGRAPGPRLMAASPELANTGNIGDGRRLHP